MAEFELKGKIRNADNKILRGYQIDAYDSDTFSRDDFLGDAKTDSDGMFKINFDDSEYNGFFEFDGKPDIYLEIFDRSGKKIITTRIEKTQREIEYQIMLGSPKPDLGSPNIYSDNLNRILSMMGDVGDMLSREYQINLSALNSERIPQEIKQRFQRFVDGHEQRQRNFDNFTALLNGLATSALEQANLSIIGYDGPQVPARPRSEVHNHVIIWPRKD